MTQPIESLTSWLWLICSGIAIIGSAYAVFAAFLIRRLSKTKPPQGARFPGITVLKPLYGAEPQLAANLRSFAEQDYPGPVQIVCGVRDWSDPAVAVVRNLSETPGSVFELAGNAPDIGENRKISNIANMMQLARHELVALSDSDMRVDPAYLRTIAACFDDPSVGLVTCYYRGVPVAGFWSKLHATVLDHHFLPNALVGIALKMAEPCFGSTIAMRRETLTKIGGFEAFADKLADDYEIGRAVRKTGAKAAIPPVVLAHTCGESSLSEVFAHELRWAKTIRLIDPIGHAGSLVTHPLPFALIAGFFAPSSPLSLGIVALTLACRSLIPIQMQRGFKAEGASIALGPVRDLLSFAVFLASFLPSSVTWRGHKFRVLKNGSMAAD